MKKFAAIIVLGCLAAAPVACQKARAQENAAPSSSEQQAQELGTATQAMDHRHHHHDAGPHMKMSALRDPQPGDSDRAQKIVEQARAALEKYRDSNAALADGYKIFLPNLPQPMYHFTNYTYAFGAAFNFDPTKPTSLLYEKHDGKYTLIGAMYTAPVRFTEDQINQRVPLSVAQWHQHVNMCKPPKGQELEQLKPNAQFGLRGSISTKGECEAAGGTFFPHVFGWMVHMYPWEKTPDEIWSVERQLQKPGHDHHEHGEMK